MEKAPRFSSHQKRIENSAKLVSILDEVLLTKTRDEWGKLFDENGVLWGPVLSNAEVIADPQVWENECFVDVDHPVVGRMKLIASPAVFSKTLATVRTAAPELGQHTEEVLIEVGYSWEDIALLKDQGAIM